MIVWGGDFNTGGRYCAQAGPPIMLSAARHKVDGINTVHLTWSGATSSQVDISRCVQQDDSEYDCNPAPIVTTDNDGSYNDSTGDTGRTRYQYRVCEAGTETCSNTVKATFPQ
jgi:hypothetical protein